MISGLEEKCMRVLSRGLLFCLLPCLPAVSSASNLVVDITTTIPVQNVYPVFILCNDVPATSCNPSAPLPANPHRE
jgi:hypothetical protein